MAEFLNFYDDFLLKETHSNIKNNSEEYMFQFFCHNVRIDNQYDCVIAMEVETRYAMLFTYLTIENIHNFIGTMMDRWKKELRLLMNFNGRAISKINVDSNIICVQEKNRSVHSHIRQVKKELELTFKRLNRLPKTEKEIEDFGARANHMRRKNCADGDYFYPYEKMKEKINKLVLENL